MSYTVSNHWLATSRIRTSNIAITNLTQNDYILVASNDISVNLFDSAVNWTEYYICAPAWVFVTVATTLSLQWQNVVWFWDDQCMFVKLINWTWHYWLSEKEMIDMHLTITTPTLTLPITRNIRYFIKATVHTTIDMTSINWRVIVKNVTEPRKRYTIKLQINSADADEHFTTFFMNKFWTSIDLDRDKIYDYLYLL